MGTEYEVRKVGNHKFVELKNAERIFDWDNCTVQIAPSPLKKLRLYIRGYANRYSDYHKKIVKPTYMLSVDIDSITPPPNEEEYQIGVEREDLKSLQHKRYRRYVFGLDNRYWIWEWNKNYADIKQSKVYSIYSQMIEYLDNLSQKMVQNPNVISALFQHTDKDLLPTIYQPAIDQLKNFVREIHCFETFGDSNLTFIEVSILFNNEQLRRHKILNRFYEKLRLFLYGRVIDIESFRIYLDTTETDKPYFTFEKIYSANHGIEEDTIHEDSMSTVPIRREISNYFADMFHPVVFINTSNHAMAEKDNNEILWKWEYRPFDEKSPVLFGNKSRKEIDSQFMPPVAKFMRWILGCIDRFNNT